MDSYVVKTESNIVSAAGKPGRKEWVDLLRALAMLFVIYGHLLAGFGHTEYFIITSPIKIPLFFAVTGYVFNGRGGNVREFFVNLFKKLVIPFLFFTAVLMPFKLLAAYKGLIDHSVKEVLISFVTGNELWYLPCCIIAEILFFFVLKLFKKEPAVVCACVGLAALSFLLCRVEQLDLFNFNTAFTAQLFILVGYLFRCHEELFRKLRAIVIPAGIALYAGLCVLSFLVFPGKSIDVHNNYYYNLPLNLGMTVIGLFALFALASLIRVKILPLSFVGRNTLVYYTVHEYAVGGIGLALTLLHIKDSGSYLFELVILLITCGLCALAALFINRFLPFAVGKKYKKKESAPPAADALPEESAPADKDGDTAGPDRADQSINVERKQNDGTERSDN
jgi:fucose 4-O-acetylase-like acetyltransferase